MRDGTTQHGTCNGRHWISVATDRSRETLACRLVLGSDRSRVIRWRSADITKISDWKGTMLCNAVADDMSMCPIYGVVRSRIDDHR